MNFPVRNELLLELVTTMQRFNVQTDFTKKTKLSSGGWLRVLNFRVSHIQTLKVSWPIIPCRKTLFFLLIK